MTQMLYVMNKSILEPRREIHEVEISIYKEEGFQL